MKNPDQLHADIKANREAFFALDDAGKADLGDRLLLRLRESLGNAMNRLRDNLRSAADTFTREAAYIEARGFDASPNSLGIASFRVCDIDPLCAEIATLQRDIATIEALMKKGTAS